MDPQTRTIHWIIGCDPCGSEKDKHIYHCFYCPSMLKLCLECLTDHVIDIHPEVADVYITPTPL